jgi:hypothetical protein
MPGLSARTLRLGPLVLFLLAPGLLLPRPAAAFKEVDQFLFGMVGIVRGQTVRLNVVNSIAAEPGVPDEACVVGLMFIDDTSVSLGEAISSRLMPGRSVFLDFTISDPEWRVAQRLQLRGLVKAFSPDTGQRPGGMPPRDACQGLISTMEVFANETGQTMVIQHPAEIRGFNPQPEPPALPGVRRGIQQ